MKRTITATGLAALALALAIGGASRAGVGAQDSQMLAPAEPSTAGSSQRAGETLWIYVEDFEDPFADDWTVLDLSGTMAQDNYWHIDTIRPRDGAGDHSWWCGTYNSCWLIVPTERGYANDWYQVLSRHFAGVTGTGTETVEIEFDQRFAMERDYDYGYVDIFDDGGGSWVTLATYTNPGTFGGGMPVDWDDPTYGHVVLDVSSYSGADIDLRFRFESDGAYSSADRPNVDPYPVGDGAWQLDNIEIQVDDAATFADDCEGGDTGWTHDPFPGAGQTGVTWWRGQYGIDFEIGRASAPVGPSIGDYMYVPIDPATGKMVDYEYTWLISPPIYVGGSEQIVSEWDGWLDLPDRSNDHFDMRFWASDDVACVGDPVSALDTGPYWYGGPFWMEIKDDWSLFGGRDWFSAAYLVYNSEPPWGSGKHGVGFFLNSLKVGIPVSTGIVEADFTNRLSHASPNPFNPVTRIAYSTKEAGPVAIKVYNVAGEVVRTLLDAELEAGETGEILWDGANDRGERCASGVYFYSIAAPGYNETKKMVLLE